MPVSPAPTPPPSTTARMKTVRVGARVARGPRGPARGVSPPRRPRRARLRGEDEILVKYWVDSPAGGAGESRGANREGAGVQPVLHARSGTRWRRTSLAR